MKTIAFVTPWYGENIPGGAETECRNLVQHLKAAGVDVEVLTTCVKEFSSDWSYNYHKEGNEIINDILVRRFKIRKRNTELFDKVNYKLMNNIKITYDEEQIYFDEMIYSKDLFEYIRKNQDRYNCFVFIPYMFGTTYWGSLICPSKSVLIPCLHDESYAYMEHIKDMFLKVKGLIFHAQPEYDLAKKIYNLDFNCRRYGVLGEGIDTNFTYDSNRFLKKYNIDSPFVLYAGRKDKGKNVDLLLNYFNIFIERNPEVKLSLVLIGGGSIDIPKSVEHRVYDLGFVPVQDKYDAYAAATFLCQPSTNESFSIVIMESWIAQRPVLVHESCKVTRHFASKSNGGLYFKNYYEFQECTLFFLRESEIANRMGLLGRKFVLDNFSWDVIVKRYADYFKTF